MSNTKGNAYPYWIITNHYEVKAVDEAGNETSKSEQAFALELGIAEDGTLWALSTNPDPDGGGSKLFWSNGDGNWTEINNPETGGVRISGGTGSSCIYLDSNGDLKMMQTDGSTSMLYQGNTTNYIVEFDYGGGFLWATESKNGNFPALVYTDNVAGPLSFKDFPNAPSPFGLSVNYNGDCYGNDSFTVKYYSRDGSGTGNFGTGADGETLTISFKNWTYIVTTDANQDGNLVYVWEDIAGGTYKPTNTRAYSVLATYYRKDG